MPHYGAFFYSRLLYHVIDKFKKHFLNLTIIILKYIIIYCKNKKDLK